MVRVRDYAEDERSYLILRVVPNPNRNPTFLFVY